MWLKNNTKGLLNISENVFVMEGKITESKKGGICNGEFKQKPNLNFM